MSTGDIISELNVSIPRAVQYESGNLDFPPYITAQTLLAAKLEIERLRAINERQGLMVQELHERLEAVGVSDMTKNRKSK